MDAMGFDRISPTKKIVKNNLEDSRLNVPTDAIGYLGGGFKYFLMFTAIPGEMIRFDEHIFQMGLVQPPTSYEVIHLFP